MLKISGPITLIAVGVACFSATLTVAAESNAPRIEPQHPAPSPNQFSANDYMADGLRVAQLTDDSSPLDDLFESDDEETPSSTDELFGNDDEAHEPDSTDELFGIAESSPSSNDSSPFGNLSGFWQNELAYAYQNPEHYSKWKNHLQLSWTGSMTENIDWKVSGRLIYDPVFEIDNFYSDKVEDDQKLDGYFLENYLDVALGNWELRLGRQYIVWGEAVGLFFADVVSGLDLREFVLPEFELIRLPQWAARAEYFEGDFYGEVVWIPVVTTDNIGEFGAEFYPIVPNSVPPGVNLRVLDENVPRDPASEFGFGARGSYLKNGWDTSLFYYTSPDRGAAFERQITSTPIPTVTFRPIHKRIHQFGGTVAKDLDNMLLKAEAVYTKDRLASVSRLSDIDGLIETDELRYLVSADWALAQHRANLQFFQTWFVDHDRDMTPDEIESGFSVLLTTEALHRDITPEILWIRSLDRDEWLVQAKVDWRFSQNWRFTLGADVFGGPPEGLLGQYDAKDRVYYELRYSF
ncbi:MAG: hypothetical protein ACI8XZ_002703 [Gammaproteobacteria bacterium]|jgi:hypothetical protein